MTSAIGIGGNVPALSATTLGLLQDTGWYTVSYDQAETLPWGLQRGCDFALDKCIASGGEVADPDLFCKPNISLTLISSPSELPPHPNPTLLAPVNPTLVVRSTGSVPEARGCAIDRKSLAVCKITSYTGGAASRKVRRVPRSSPSPLFRHPESRAVACPCSMHESCTAGSVCCLRLACPAGPW